MGTAGPWRVFVRARVFVVPVLLLLMLGLSGCGERGTTGSGSLVAHWAFDEGTGTAAADKSGNKNGVTLYGASWEAGKTGKAVQLDGAKAYLEVKDADSLDLSGAFTIAAWVNLAELGKGRQVLLEKKAPGDPDVRTNYTLYVQWTHDALALVIADGTRQVGYLSDRGLGTTGTWRHVAVVLGSGEVRFYIDGKPAGTRKATVKPHVNAGPLVIGRYTAQDRTVRFHLNGAIDELQIHSKALSPDEVKKLAGGT